MAILGLAPLVSLIPFPGSWVQHVSISAPGPVSGPLVSMVEMGSKNVCGGTAQPGQQEGTREEGALHNRRQIQATLLRRQGLKLARVSRKHLDERIGFMSSPFQHLFYVIEEGNGLGF